MATGNNPIPMAMARGESSNAVQAKERQQFPVGMRVVAIDDDRISLAMLNKLLTKCQYQVTCFTNALEALKMIKENKDEIDLVLTDVHMPYIDGFKLLEIAGHQLDLPVIMISANDTKESVRKGIMNGACDYLIKPVWFKELSLIWKQVAKRHMSLEQSNEDVMNNHQTIIEDDNIERGQRDIHGGNSDGHTSIVSGMETLSITQGDSEFDWASFSTDDIVADYTSSSTYHDIDDVSISGLDELLSSLRTGDGGHGANSLPFIDDDFFN